MASESLLVGYSRLLVETVPRRLGESINSLRFALKGRAADVHTEQAFRRFLDLERMRAARSQRTFFLLLVSLRRCPERGTCFPSRAAVSVLQGLALCLRDVDVIGWYRSERIAGAVLTQGSEAPDAEAPRRIVERITGVLSERMPGSVAGRLQLRLIKLGTRLK